MALAQDLYLISVAARMLGMHPQTLRKYERLGLIQPSRTIGSMRLYSREELERVRLIKHLVDEAGINLAGVQRLLSIVDRHTPRGLRDHALLEFLYGTGARISEAVGASIDDLALRDATVRLIGKGHKTRVVPIGSYARDAIDAYLVRGRPTLVQAGRGSPAVFLNARGGRLSRQAAWMILRKAAEQAGLPVDGPHGVSPHTLRHSYATHLLDGGADIRVVQELLGHTSVATTQVYTLVTVDKLREVYATAHPRAR